MEGWRQLVQGKLFCRLDQALVMVPSRPKMAITIGVEMVLISENISDLTIFFCFAAYSNQNPQFLNKRDRWDSHSPSDSGQQKTYWECIWENLCSAIFEKLSLMQSKQKIMATSIMFLPKAWLPSRLLLELFYFYKCIMNRPEKEQAR